MADTLWYRDPVADDWTQITGITIMGSDSGGTAVTKKEVNFYDYEGTLIAGYTIAEANTLSALPSAPDRSADGLTFQEWNYTLAQVNATTTRLDVGATYAPTDGTTKLFVTLNAVTGLSPTLYVNKSDGSTLTIDWKDGTTDTITGNGNQSKAHTYSAAGSYAIECWISSGSGTFTFGWGSTTYTCFRSTYAKSLTAVYFGSNTTLTIAYAFYNHTSLTTVVIPSGIASLANDIFEGCNSLRCCVVPNGATTIGNYAFQNAYALSAVSLPSSVSALGTYAFCNCVALDSIVVPDSMTSIGTAVLQGCSALRSVSLPSGIGSIGNSAFQGCEALASITLPSGVLSIDTYAFNSCRCLTEVSIPLGVGSIGARAFAGNYAMKKYVMLPTSPPTLSSTNTFTDISPACVISVPAASLIAYQTAAYWSTYANYMEGY